MRRPKIVLIQPRVGDMDDFRDQPTPPMSLIHAATSVRQAYDVRIVDQRVERNWRERLGEELAEKPLLVGLTTLSGPMIGRALEIARFIRTRSDVPIVWGGTHVSLAPSQTISAKEVDYVVVGEGEEAIHRLADAVARGGTGTDIPGVWARRGQQVFRNARNAPLDYSRAGPAPYDLVDMEKYMYTHRGRKMFEYLSSRGCPHACTYCYNTVFRWRSWSAKPASVVRTELKVLKEKYGFESVYFLDDNFFVNRKRAWEIAGAMQSLGLRYEIQGVDIQSLARMTDEELNRLEETGLERLTVGIESVSDRLRRMIGKWGDSDTVLATLKRLAGRKFLVLTSFIIGFPTETEEELRRTVRFAMYLQFLGPNFRLPQFYNFTPVPGTELSRRLEEEGFIFPRTLEEWKHFDWDRNMIYKGNGAKRRSLEAIAFLSKFLDRKYADYGSKRLVGTLYRLYRPVAFARLFFELHRFLPEKTVYRMVERML